MSGCSCARTGSPTASSPPTATSSITAVRRGTSSQTSPGASCPSDCAIGRTGSDQWDLVSAQSSALLLLDMAPHLRHHKLNNTQNPAVVLSQSPPASPPCE